MSFLYTKSLFLGNLKYIATSVKNLDGVEIHPKSPLKIISDLLGVSASVKITNE